MFVAKLNEVLASKKSFFGDPLNFISLGIAGLLNIIHWLLLYGKIRPNQPSVLLHYNVVVGADFIGPSIYLYWIPLLALILLFINFVVSAFFYNKEKLASYFLNVATIPVQLIFFAATLVLIVINS